MKTTVDIAEPLLKRAKKLAAKEKVSLKSLIESGLRRVLREHQEEQAFQLRRVTFDGNGIREDFRDSSWQDLVDHVYQGRGGK